MISSWRKLRGGRRSKKEQPGRETGASSLMKDPISTLSTEITEKQTTPVSSVEVLQINSNIKTASEIQDRDACKDMVAKIKEWAKESETNKRCIVGNGAATVLAAAFDSFSTTCLDDEIENVSVLEEILSSLTFLFPLDRKALTFLGSPLSTHCIVRFLKSADLSVKRNSVLILRDLVSNSDSENIPKSNVLSEIIIEGSIIESLFKLIEKPISATATKSALVVIYHAITSSPATSSRLIIIQRLVEMGLVSLLLEMLVDAQRSVCEKALSVLDVICSSDCGRQNACDEPLTVPVIVKKILRVSVLATELSVSIMWNLCKNEKREEKDALVVEALQVGAFQKLLLLLQVGCAEKTKEKATELLKLMNLHRDRLECYDGWIKSM